MKRLKWFILLTLSLMVCMSPIVVYAGTIPGHQTEGGGGGGGSSEPVNPHPAYSTFTPKVTIVHNINALAAECSIDPSSGNDAVYYIPTLEDLPFSVKDYVQTRTTYADGTYRSFAYVYDGYFDSEARLSQAVTSNGSDNTSYSSVSVSTGNVSNPILKDIGYDLLLKEEAYQLNAVDGNLVFTNRSVLAGTSELKANEAIMDIYKALGKFEYKVDTAFIQDEDWVTKSSPILSEISVLTSQEGHSGLDITESYCGVAISRTTPSLYWNRLIRDGVLSSTTQSVGNGSTKVTAQITGDSGSSISMIEFLSTAVALMNLYGEETLSDEIYQYCVSTCASQLTNIASRSEEDKVILTYLLAKGILDPNMLHQMDLDGPVYLLYEYNGEYARNQGNVIIDILSRIANTDRRLQVATSYPNISKELAVAGYGQASFTVNPYIFGYTEVLSDFATFYDFLIEKNDVTCSKAKISSTSPGTGDSDAGVSRDVYDAINNMRIFADGVEIAPISTASKIDPTQTNMYLYYGVKKYNGVEYFHFKVHPGLFNDKSSIFFGYSDSPEGEEVVTCKKTELPNLNGGIYRYTGGQCVYSSFKEAGFSEEFVDSDSYIGPLSTEWSTITFKMVDTYVNPQRFESMAGNDSLFNWKAVFNGQNVIVNQRIDLLKNGLSAAQKSQNETYVYIKETTAENNYYIFQVTTKVPSKVQQSEFVSYGSSGGVTTGYYRASDGSLMVSYTYLHNIGLVSGLRKISADTWVMTSGSTNTCITLHEGSNNPYIIVGDTYFPVESEKLVLEVNGTTYMNYRACLGWGDKFSVISDGDFATAYSITADTTMNERTVSVKEFFPASTIKMLALDLKSNSSFYTNELKQTYNPAKDVTGIMLSGSNCLSPYLLVNLGENTDIDMLFVWHRDGLVDSQGNTYTISDETDKAARDELARYTGISLNALDNYKLKSYQLYRDDQMRSNPRGLYYIRKTYTTMAATTEVTMGWFWIPPEYTDCQKALDDYAASAGDGKNLVLPIFTRKVAGTNRTEYCDANVNVCSKDNGGSYLSVGTMPYYFGSRSENDKNNYAKINSSGTAKADTDAGEDTSSYSIFPAPTSLFSQLKLMGSSSLKDMKRATVYYGTARVINSSGTWKINNKATSFGDDTKTVCNYTANSNLAVYAVMEEGTALGGLLEEIDTKLGYLLDDPSSLVDWDKYKFTTLINNLDSISTVALIFVLNIMPVVGMSLFFILMILSLIKDYPFWRKFCNRWFDIYSFLSMGHITVDTVDTKRIFLISLACFSIFVMIWNGTLFNFILFIAKLLVAMYQR